MKSLLPFAIRFLNSKTWILFILFLLPEFKFYDSRFPVLNELILLLNSFGSLTIFLWQLSISIVLISRLNKNEKSLIVFNWLDFFWLCFTGLSIVGFYFLNEGATKSSIKFGDFSFFYSFSQPVELYILTAIFGLLILAINSTLFQVVIERKKPKLFKTVFFFALLFFPFVGVWILNKKLKEPNHLTAKKAIQKKRIFSTRVIFVSFFSLSLITLIYFSGNLIKTYNPPDLVELPVDSFIYLNTYQNMEAFPAFEKINITFSDEITKRKKDSLPVLLKDIGANPIENDIQKISTKSSLFNILKPVLELKENRYILIESAFLGSSEEKNIEKLNSIFSDSLYMKNEFNKLSSILWTNNNYSYDSYSLIFVKSELKTLNKDAINLSNITAIPNISNSGLMSNFFDENTFDLKINVKIDLNRFKMLPQFGILKIYSGNMVYYGEIDTRLRNQNIIVFHRIPEKEIKKITFTNNG